MTFLRTTAALAACLTAGVAAAQTPAPMPKLRQICAADFQKLWPDATPATAPWLRASEAKSRSCRPTANSPSLGAARQ